MRVFGLLFLVALVGCDDVENPTGLNPEEVITTVNLTFTPDDGGAASTFTWDDPENDGSPVIDDIVLTPGMYTMDVAFLNSLENPPEDITAEVNDESDEHQVFVLGSVVAAADADIAPPEALFAHSYADMDSNGLPVGLTNTISIQDLGTGDLRIVLRHLPEQAGVVQKVAGLAAIAASGVEQLPGESDVDVTFTVTVE